MPVPPKVRRNLIPANYSLADTPPFIQSKSIDEFDAGINNTVLQFNDLRDMYLTTVNEIEYDGGELNNCINFC